MGDGKQARRTNSSSPLGQLFDHGCDCTTVFLIVHSGTVVCGLSGTRWEAVNVSVGIFTFFIAQWQEYHLHVMPHAVGPLGVTEQQLLCASIFVGTGLFGTGIWQTSLGVCQLSHAFCLMQLVAMVATSGISILKVIRERSTAVTTASPLVHLVTPVALCVLAVSWSTASVAVTPALVLLATAIPATHLCCKIIVFSMAKAPYAMVHLEAGPAVLVYLMDFFIGGTTLSSVLLGLSISLSFASFAHFIRTSIQQLCLHLRIQCFKIAKAKTEDPSPIAGTSATPPPGIKFPPKFRPTLQCEKPAPDDSVPKPTPSPSQVL